MYKTKNIINAVLIQNNCQKINVISLIHSEEIISKICPQSYSVFRFRSEKGEYESNNDYAVLPINDPMTNISYHCVIYDFTDLKKAYYCKQLSSVLSIPSIAIYPENISNEVKRRYSLELENLSASVNVLRTEGEKELWGIRNNALVVNYLHENIINNIIQSCIEGFYQ